MTIPIAVADHPDDTRIWRANARYSQRRVHVGTVILHVAAEAVSTFAELAEPVEEK